MYAYSIYTIIPLDDSLYFAEIITRFRKPVVHIHFSVQVSRVYADQLLHTTLQRQYLCFENHIATST